MSEDRADPSPPHAYKLAFARAALLLAALAALAIAGSAAGSRDLTASVSAPTPGIDNTTIAVNLTAYNAGTGAGSTVQLQLYLDGNATGPVHDVGNLANGENASAFENLTLACGVHQLNVTVDPSDGVPETDETNNNASLTLLVLPFANFSYVLTGSPGTITVELDAAASHGCAPLNYTWNLGGFTRYGALANTTPPAGDLTAILVVQAPSNPLLLNSLKRVIPIPNGGPLLTVSVPSHTIQTLTPLALAIEADDPDGSVDAYFIDFGDGNTSTSLVDAATYRYHASGAFNLTVRVTDNLGATNETRLSLAVSNRLPEADTSFGFWVTTVGTPVTFNASRSSDPEGAPLTIVWQFGDGSNATGPVVNHTYANPGSYTVNVTVTDAAGDSRTAQVNVRVEPAPSTGWLLPVIGGIIALLALLLLLFLLLGRRRRDGTQEVPPKSGEPNPPPKSAGEGSSPKPPSP